MSCVKKKTDALCAITLKITLVAFLISSLPEIAQAAMPVLNANPFTQAQNALKTLIENGRGIELNCNRGNQPLPDGKWLKIYRELGGEVITLGTDAHSTQHVGCSVRERQALLKSCTPVETHDDAEMGTT